MLTEYNLLDKPILQETEHGEKINIKDDSYYNITIDLALNIINKISLCSKFITDFILFIFDDFKRKAGFYFFSLNKTVKALHNLPHRKKFALSSQIHVINTQRIQTNE